MAIRSGIGDAAPHHLVDGRLGARDELLDVGVVRLRLALADDGHASRSPGWRSPG